MKFKINLQNNINESNMDASDALHVWRKKFDKSGDIFHEGVTKVRKVLSSHKEINVTEYGFDIISDGIVWKLKINIDINNPLYEKIYKQLESIKNNKIYGGYGYRCDLDMKGNMTYIFSGFANFGNK